MSYNSYKMLIINLDPTFTEISVYEDDNPIIVENLGHALDEINMYSTIYDQFEFMKDIILNLLEKKNFNINDIDAVVSKGGLLKPIEGGTYTINKEMIEDLKNGVQGHHILNIGGIIAYEIAKSINKPAFIVDPVVVDELDEIAKVSGIPEITRRSMFNALNQKAMARKYAFKKGKKYKDINVIVAYIDDSEISIGAHRKGKVIDVNNIFDGEGPFSSDRSGGIPTADFVNLCYSGQYTKSEISNMINGEGGFAAYLNKGDVKSVLVSEAMRYQIAKEIGKCAAVLQGNVDAIILTGKTAYSKETVNYIRDSVSFIAPIIVYPGKDEMLALAQGGLRVLKGEEKVKEYK